MYIIQTRAKKKVHVDKSESKRININTCFMDKSESKSVHEMDIIVNTGKVKDKRMKNFWLQIIPRLKQ